MPTGAACESSPLSSFQGEPREPTPELAGAPTPGIRLVTEHVVIDRGGHGADAFAEEEHALIELFFDYPILGRITASDWREEVYCAGAAGMSKVRRRFEDEGQARHVLERFGAIDLECLEHYGVAPDCDANYLVRLDGDVHTVCAFTAQVLPELRALGWTVEVPESYPFQVVEEDVSFYADVAPQERPDWFGLELGCEVGGQKVNLLPVFLDILDETSGARSLESIAQSTGGFIALPVSDTHHVGVSQDRLRALLQVVIELYDGEGGASQADLAFNRQQAAALVGLDDAFADGEEDLSWDDPAGLRAFGDKIAPKQTPRVEAPPELLATLRPYQQEGLDWLQSLVARDVGGVLADDMGLGKTLQTIAHITAEKAAGRLTEPALVIVPTSLVGGWQKEIRKFAPHLSVVVLHGPKRHPRWLGVPHADVVITSYPVIVRDEERFVEQPFHLQVLDEAQTIKNPRSLAHLACKRVQARHRLCLTGTPVENHLGELWALMDFLNSGLLGNTAHFKIWYRNPIEKDGDEERLAALRQLVEPYLLRRMKSDVAKDLPPKTEIYRPVELEGKQRELYEHIRVAAHAQVRRVIRHKGFSNSAIPILDALTKLRQVCCDPRLVRMEAARFVKQSAKFQALMELVETQLAEGHRILVFSQFTSMLALIEEGLEERGVRQLKLTGSSKNRQDIVDSFEAGEADVFLISLKAGGTGLNLVSADTVIHYDHWWNPAAQAQATDRAYRIGQKKPVFVYNLFVAGSVEESMLRLQRRKKHLADAILGQGGANTAIDEDDLEVLFAPLRD